MNKKLMEFKTDKYKVVLLSKSNEYIIFINNSKVNDFEDFDQAKDFYFNITKQLIERNTIV